MKTETFRLQEFYIIVLSLRLKDEVKASKKLIDDVVIINE